SPYVECQAILTRAGIAEHMELRAARLDAVSAKLCGVANARPTRRRLRRLPAQIAHRRRSKRNRLESASLPVHGVSAVDITFVGLHYEWIGGMSRARASQSVRVILTFQSSKQVCAESS